MAKDYAMNIDGGMKGWRWGKEDYYADQLKLARANKLAGGGGKGGKGRSGKTIILNQLPPEMDRIVNSPSKSGTIPFGVKDKGIWSDTFGIQRNNKTNSSRATGILNAVDRDSGTNYDMSNAIDLQLGEYVIKDGKRYISATATFDADEPRANNPHVEDYFGVNQLADESGATKSNWRDINIGETNLNFEEMGYGADRDIWVGEVLIPIDKQMLSPGYLDTFNKLRGITSAQQTLSQDASHQDYIDQASSPEAQQAVEDIEVEFGVTNDVALEMYQNQLREGGYVSGEDQQSHLIKQNL
jgi:hypothetical protein